jgi:hypothetical protein
VTTRGLLYAGVAALAFVAVLAMLLPALRYGPALNGATLIVPTGDLLPGHYKVYERGRERYYVLRPSADRIVVLAVPLRDGAVLLPARHWGRDAGSRCRDFGPQAQDGALVDGARLACRDPGLAAQAGARYVWDAAGHYAGTGGGALDDLPAPHFERLAAAIAIHPGR